MAEIVEVQIRKYTAKSGAPFPAAKAQEVGESLENIRTEYGENLTPDMVVNEAQDTNHQLHPYFDWDNHEAAIKWRRQQARMIINHVEVEIIIADAKPQKIRAFYNIKNTGTETAEDERAYLDVETILTNDFYCDQAKQDALQRLLHWKKEYEQWDLTEFKPIMKEIERLEDTLTD